MRVGSRLALEGPRIFIGHERKLHRGQETVEKIAKEMFLYIGLVPGPRGGSKGCQCKDSTSSLVEDLSIRTS